MTFRTRLVLASTVAVVVAVLAASTASYLAARNTLVNAADNSLTAAAAKITSGATITTTNATYDQVVDSSGSVIVGGDLPVTDQVRQVAAGTAPSYFTTVNVGGNQFRELVEPLPVGTTFNGQQLEETSALQIVTLLNATRELDRLGLVLGGVALSGVLLAIVLGLLVARTALVPLNALTDTVEDLAETTDVSRRLSPGGPDELGRLRRTFNRLLEALESSRRAQSQLVLDASHELRTPLTSLRTNLEVIRRVDELTEADRSVLVDDVLVQLQELTDLVGDMAELARGDQTPHLDRAAPPRPPGTRRHRGGGNPRPHATGDFRARGRGVLGGGRPGPTLPGHRESAGQRPQMEPGRGDGVGELPGGNGGGARSGAGHRAGGPPPCLRSLLSSRRRPGPPRVRARLGHRLPGGQGRRRHHHGRGGRGWRHTHVATPPHRGGTGRRRG